MEDPDNPKNGLPPAPPSPEEEWAGLDGSKYLHHLTDSNFDEFVKKKDSVLVMFYAPCKCGDKNIMKHCLFQIILRFISDYRVWSLQVHEVRLRIGSQEDERDEYCW